MNKKQIHEKMMHSIHQKETVDGVAKKCINSTLNQYEIYGNSEYDRKNILPDIMPTQTLNGITLTNNGDGTYTLNGTATASTKFECSLPTVIKGVYILSIHIISGTTSNDDCPRFNLLNSSNSGVWVSKTNTGSCRSNPDVEYVKFWISEIVSGTTFDNYTFGLQIEKGITSTDFEPYKYPTPDTPIEIKSVGDLITDTSDANYGKYKIPVKVGGRNLFSIDKVSEHEGNELHCSIKDNIITLKGATTNKASWFNLFLPSILPKNRYYIRMNVDNTAGLLSKIYVRYGSDYSLTGGSSKVLGGYYNNTYGITDSIAVVTIQVQPNTTIDTKIKIGIGYKASDISQYEPYIPSETYNIYLDEPLRGIGDYKDKIDFRSGTVIRNVRKFHSTTVTGVEKDYNFYVSLANQDAVPNYFKVICNQIPNTYNKIVNELNCFIGNTGRYFNFQNPNIEHTISAGTEFLQQYNPEVIYPLEVPIIEQIDLPRLPQVKGTIYYSIDTDVSSEFIGTYKYKN